MTEILKQTRSICSTCGEIIPAMYEVREIINKSFSRAPAHLTVPQTPTLATGDIIKLRAEDLWDVRVKYRMG